eukprot:3941553-Rhodomonas_salina.2
MSGGQEPASVVSHLPTVTGGVHAPHGSSEAVSIATPAFGNTASLLGISVSDDGYTSPCTTRPTPALPMGDVKRYMSCTLPTENICGWSNPPTPASQGTCDDVFAHFSGAISGAAVGRLCGNAGFLTECAARVHVLNVFVSNKGMYAECSRHKPPAPPH